MRHGDAGAGRRGQRGRDAGNDLEFDPVLRQKLQFLAAAAKEEAVAALEPDDVLPLERPLQ